LLKDLQTEKVATSVYHLHAIQLTLYQYSIVNYYAAYVNNVI